MTDTPDSVTQDGGGSFRQWLRCLTGRHEWVELACDPDQGGMTFEFCLWCGESR